MHVNDLFLFSLNMIHCNYIKSIILLIEESEIMSYFVHSLRV